MLKTNEKINNLKKNFLLLLTTVIIFLIFFEILLRLFTYPIYGFQEEVFEYDEITGYKLSKNYSGKQSIYGNFFDLQTNSKGLRDFREYDYKKSEEVYRILILGDSFSFGNGVNLEESYPEYLRENFKDENIEIINLGIPGYGINNEYLLFLEEGKKYEPDLILIQFYLNDWGTHQLTEEKGKIIVDKKNSLVADDKGFLVSSGKLSFIKKIHLFSLKNSRTYSFVYSKSRNTLTPLIDNYRKKSSPFIFYSKDSPEYKEKYEGYYSILRMLDEKTDSKIVLFVGPFQSDFISPEKIKEEYNLEDIPNLRQSQESVNEIANSLNLSMINITSEEKDIFIEIDGHWNSKGNKLVADKLYEELKPLLKNS
jgi:lysophospholipase L1-like esterase